MKIIDQSVSVLSLNGIEGESLLREQLSIIEMAGRTAYKSEDKIIEGSSSQFVKMIRDIGHDSVLEHSLMTVVGS